MTFEEAVQAAPCPVNTAFRPGKEALERRHRNQITCDDPQRLTGSIDLDSALKRDRVHAGKPRWDYGLGYRSAGASDQAVWVEVHPATTKEVSRVLDKLQWLRDWLNVEGEQLGRLTERTDPNVRFVWIASTRVAIPKNSPQARRLNKRGIRQVLETLSLR